MKRRVTPPEAELWRRVTRDVRPARQAADFAPVRPAPAGVADVGASLSRSSFAGPAIAAVKANGKVVARPVDTGVARGSPDVVGAGDPRADRRVRRGALAIERRLDLHGLTQAAAEQRLAAFLAVAHRDRCRCVLVITGKGAPQNADAGHGAVAADDAKVRGVLRARFRDWVNAPALKPLIARVSPAARSDGGDGAWYVFLKREAKTRRQP